MSSLTGTPKEIPMNRNEEFVKELKKYVPSDSNVDIYLKNNVVYIASKEEE